MKKTLTVRAGDAVYPAFKDQVDGLMATMGEMLAADPGNEDPHVTRLTVVEDAGDTTLEVEYLPNKSAA